MSKTSRTEKIFSVSLDIDEILLLCNIQQYYVNGVGFDFDAFVQMALNYDEKEAEKITYTKMKKESLKTQMNKEDKFIDFSDEELSCIFFDVLNYKIA